MPHVQAFQIDQTGPRAEFERDKKKNLNKTEVSLAYASAQHTEMWGASACFGFFCSTSFVLPVDPGV